MLAKYASTDSSSVSVDEAYFRSGEENLEIGKDDSDVVLASLTTSLLLERLEDETTSLISMVDAGDCGIDVEPGSVNTSSMMRRMCAYLVWSLQ